MRFLCLDCHAEFNDIILIGEEDSESQACPECRKDDFILIEDDAQS
jgi:DNA-directed RNA polymerase subunit RPC12/RpoP